MRQDNTYMHQQTGFQFVPVMHLLSTETLPEPMLTHCHLDPQGQTPVKFQAKWNNYNQRKCIGSQKISIQWYYNCRLGIETVLWHSHVTIPLSSFAIASRKIVCKMPVILFSTPCINSRPWLRWARTARMKRAWSKPTASCTNSGYRSRTNSPSVKQNANHGKSSWILYQYIS